MSERIFPSWEEISNLRTQLTDGERTLAKYFDDNLPPEWEIYVQPFLNGDRPDVVILHPENGVMIYEVKDWNLGNYRLGSNNLEVTDGDGWYRAPNPLHQVNRYRNNIFGLYVPEMGEATDEDRKAYGVIRVGVYFHKATTHRGHEVLAFRNPKELVIGSDGLRADNLHAVVPILNSANRFLRLEWIEKLRSWLRPPTHSQIQTRPLKLSSEQHRHADPQPGHYRLRGVAGSGKTAVIAWRAAKLASEGKRVLIVYFNITLGHYIQDMVRRVPLEFKQDLIEYRHFHGFCWNILDTCDAARPEGAGDEFWMEDIPRAVMLAAQNCPDHNIQYDAILVDEGQDFGPTWYELLCKFLSTRNELLFVTDQRQNIYGRDQTWVDGPMQNVQFRGKWRELNHSFRLNPQLTELANSFAERYLPGSTGTFSKSAAAEMAFSDALLTWNDFDNLPKALTRIKDAFTFAVDSRKQQPSDVVVLLPSHEIGIGIVADFEGRGVRVNHVFSRDQNDKRNKKSFWMGDPRLKMCTYHSFKGWEVSNIILVIPPASEKIEGSLPALVYTALTRMASSSDISKLGPTPCLIVLNCNVDYRDYGKAWKNRLVWPQEDSDIPF